MRGYENLMMPRKLHMMLQLRRLERRRSYSRLYSPVSLRKKGKKVVTKGNFKVGIKFSK